MTAEHYEELEIFALAQDPIYIGTGGYTLGRVDNTIVRDKATNLPKIPGSSLAGTWRYYVVLEGLNFLRGKIREKLNKIIDFLFEKGAISQDEKSILEENKEKLNTSSFNTLRVSIYKVLGLKDDKDKEENKNKKEKIRQSLKEFFKENLDLNNSDWKTFEGNRFLQITCAGQDNIPQEEIENAPFAKNNEGKTGHCGHCIVCKGFGFSKKNLSWQGQLFFNDLHIVLFPVFTVKGTKWITTERILKELLSEIGGINNNSQEGEAIKDSNSQEGRKNSKPIKVFETSNNGKDYINLGWLYLPYEEASDDLTKKVELLLDRIKCLIKEIFSINDIVIVPEHLFAHIVNSNLEVRTSVAIDPVTGAAKESALFTTEAIPRGTVFYGKIYIFDRKNFEDLEPKIKPLPGKGLLKEALKDSSHYYESLGIGGMTTRGFGRLKIWSPQWEKDSNGGNSDGTSN